MKKLHLIVPLGKEASRGDQLENAAYFVDKGYAIQLSEEDLNVQQLLTSMTLLLEQKQAYLDNMGQTQEITSVDTFYELLLTDIFKH